MKYNFEIYDWAGIRMYGISSEVDIISHLDAPDWTPDKAQSIIDGVKSTIGTEEEYKWANEDVYLISNKHAVFFIDLMSMRGGASKIKEKQDLDLPHEEFITFMEDFKKFIEENS